jgi:hypothetical protein
MSVALFGWAIVAVLVARLRPDRWRAVGQSILVGVAIAYLPTAPRDAEGWWRLSWLMLPLLAAGLSCLALVAGKVPGFLFNRLLVVGSTLLGTAGIAWLEAVERTGLEDGRSGPTPVIVLLVAGIGAGLTVAGLRTVVRGPHPA